MLSRGGTVAGDRSGVVPIWIASFPRSGNAFLRIVLKSVYGVGSHTTYQGEGYSSRWDGEGRCGAGAPDEEEPATPAFVKTHELAVAADPAPAVYLVRDGRDAYVSYAHFARASEPATYGARPFAEILRLLVASKDHFGGWSAHVAAWTQRAAPTAVLRFEDLRAEPATAATRACGELGIELPSPTGAMPSFDELRAWDPQSFRRGRTGDWRVEMPGEIEALFWRLHGAAMERLGYRRGA